MRLPVIASRRLGPIALVFCLGLIATGAAGQTPAPAPAKESTPAKPPAKQGLPPAAAAQKQWTGDFDGMVKRRVIRALVPYSKTFYFVDRAVQRGLSYEITRLLEADINRKAALDRAIDE